MSSVTVEFELGSQKPDARGSVRTGLAPLVRVQPLHMKKLGTRPNRLVTSRWNGLNEDDGELIERTFRSLLVTFRERNAPDEPTFILVIPPLGRLRMEARLSKYTSLCHQIRCSGSAMPKRRSILSNVASG